MPAAMIIHRGFSARGIENATSMAELMRASHRMRTIITALALMAGGTPLALAQDATTTTPPELRDFRLDPPPAEREAPPETPPPVTPAPSPEPTQPSSPPAASTSPRSPSVASPAPKETQSAPEPMSAPTADPLPTSAQPPTAQAAPVKQKAIAEDGVIRLGVMMLLLVLAVAGGFYLYRRPTKAPQAPMRSTVRPARKPSTQTPSPQAVSLPTAKAVAPPRQSPLSMAFVPDTLVVSLANLVLRGQLQIVNAGPDSIQGLTLRAILIAASTQQQQAIDSFFADPLRIPPLPVGALDPGERIGVSVELSVALHEMQTFALRDKTYLVPILLAHLSYDSAAPQQEAQLVTMIGREANPPTAKMGPLRLDLGPRSFGQLGQRPLPT